MRWLPQKVLSVETFRDEKAQVDEKKMQINFVEEIALEIVWWKASI